MPSPDGGGGVRYAAPPRRRSISSALLSVRRMRLHQRIAATLEEDAGADEELLAELAYHYFECAWAGNAAKAVEYCRRAADQAMARLAYDEGRRSPLNVDPDFEALRGDSAYQELYRPLD